MKGGKDSNLFGASTRCFGTVCLLGPTQKTDVLIFCSSFYENKWRVVFALFCTPHLHYFWHVINPDSSLANATVYYWDKLHQSCVLVYIFLFTYMFNGATALGPSWDNINSKVFHYLTLWNQNSFICFRDFVRSFCLILRTVISPSLHYFPT